MTTTPPKGVGVTLLIVTIIMLALSVGTVALRLIVRTWTRQMGSDDYLMVIGLVCHIPHREAEKRRCFVPQESTVSLV